jgi:hypothetical protein
MMAADRTESLLVIASAVLWLAMVGLAAMGHWLAGLYTLLPLLLIYGVLGSSHKGKFDLRLVAFPTLVWIVMWAAAFGFGHYYAEVFAGKAPDFTVLGFHPSFLILDCADPVNGIWIRGRQGSLAVEGTMGAFCSAYRRTLRRRR